MEKGISGFTTSKKSKTESKDTIRNYLRDLASFLFGIKADNKNNTSLGYASLLMNTDGAFNTSVGRSSMLNNTTGNLNTAIGYLSLYYNTTGSLNTAIGSQSIKNNTVGYSNTAIGYLSLYYNTTGSLNTAIGYRSLFSATTGNTNTAIGINSLHFNTTGNSNTAIGRNSLYDVTTESNCSGLGNDAQVTGSDQVQLGDSSTTTYVYGTVQNRSDARDKTDIKDQPLGLEFINKLRPVQFRWNLRDAYRENPEEHATEPKAGKRHHNGVIAQEIKSICEEMNIDFAGLQHHEVNGGKDVYSIGYDEFISPLIKAIQELTAKVEKLEIDNIELRSKI